MSVSVGSAPSEPGIEFRDDEVTPLGSRVFLGRCQLPGAPPGQKLVNTVDGVIGDVSQHVAQPGFGVDTVQLGRPDQRVKAVARAARVGASKQKKTWGEPSSQEIFDFALRSGAIKLNKV